MKRVVAIILMIAIVATAGADQASPVENPVLSQIQGGSNDGTGHGGNSQVSGAIHEWERN